MRRWRLPADLHRPRRGAEIDRIAAGAGGLAADRAIAAHERHRRVRLDRELHAARSGKSLRVASLTPSDYVADLWHPRSRHEMPVRGLLAALAGVGGKRTLTFASRTRAAAGERRSPSIGPAHSCTIRDDVIRGGASCGRHRREAAKGSRPEGGSRDRGRKPSAPSYRHRRHRFLAWARAALPPRPRGARHPPPRRACLSSCVSCLPPGRLSLQGLGSRTRHDPSRARPASTRSAVSFSRWSASSRWPAPSDCWARSAFGAHGDSFPGLPLAGMALYAVVSLADMLSLHEVDRLLATKIGVWPLAGVLRLAGAQCCRGRCCQTRVEGLSHEPQRARTGQSVGRRAGETRLGQPAAP